MNLGGPVCRGIGGPVYCGIRGPVCRGITGPVCADSPTKAKNAEKDKLFEVQQMKMLSEHVGQERLSISFLGSTRLFNADSDTESAEFDGVIIYPTMDIRNYFLCILEAKNYSKGCTAAKNQLTSRLDSFLPKHLEYKISKLNGRASYAEIKLKQ